MGQDEILTFLKNKREMGDDGFYSIAEVRKRLGCNKMMFQHINRLYHYGIIEIQFVNWKRYIRAKK
jgi:hypothetical protein